MCRAASDYSRAVCAFGSQDRIPGGCFTHLNRGLLRRNAFRGPGWVHGLPFSRKSFTLVCSHSMRARVSGRVGGRCCFLVHQTFSFFTFTLSSCVYRLFLSCSDQSLMPPAGSPVVIITPSYRSCIYVSPFIFTPLEARGWTFSETLVGWSSCRFFVDFLFLATWLSAGQVASLDSESAPGASPNKRNTHLHPKTFPPPPM